MTNIHDTTSEEKKTHFLDLNHEPRIKGTPILEKVKEYNDVLAIVLRMADDDTSDTQDVLKIGDYV